MTKKLKPYELDEGVIDLNSYVEHQLEIEFTFEGLTDEELMEDDEEFDILFEMDFKEDDE